jgi:hypothetical protein
MAVQLTAASAAHGATYPNYEAFKLWCEGWPDDCNAAILSDVLESGVKTKKNIIPLMSEAEHPNIRSLTKRLRLSCMIPPCFKIRRSRSASRH